MENGTTVFLFTLTKSESFFPIIGQSFFKIDRKAPQSGVVSAPQHQYKTHWNKYSTEGYLSSAVGIQAMQNAVAMSIDIQALEVFHLNYKDSMNLGAFERFFSEQLMVAVRALKQQWPSKTTMALFGT